MRRKLWTGVLLLSTAILSGACLEAEGEGRSLDSGRLLLTGSSTVGPLASEIAKRFEELHPQARIDVQLGGSSRGIADARRGLADIGMVSRALRAEESDLIAHTIALDGICLILHRDNPVASLSRQQVVDLFRGRIRNWSEVGGRNAAPVVVSKAAGRSTLELFLDYFGMESEEIQASIVIGDNQQGIKTVAGNRDAVGYVSLGAAEFALEQGEPLRLLPMEGIEATSGNVRNGSYPLRRELNLVTRPDPPPLARAFIGFARSSRVHSLVLELSYVPVQD